LDIIITRRSIQSWSRSSSSQCCQGAEISAAKHKKGRKKLCGAGKIFWQIYQKRAEKRPKRGRPNFFVVWVCTKTVTFLANTCNLPPIGNTQYVSTIWHWESVKNTIILAFLSIFYEGPNFFASGRSFWLIWQKSFERSWQHWCAVSDAKNLTCA
jgi:hypothetical protein